LEGYELMLDGDSIIETRWYLSRLKMQLLLKGYKLIASQPKLQFPPAGKERGFFLVKKPVVLYHCMNKLK